MKKTLLLFFSFLFCVATYADTLVDELTSSLIGITTTSYTEFTLDGSKTTSGVAYAGLCAGTDTYIQLRSATDKNYSGIYNTTSCGKVTKIAITWDATSYDRTINFYGSQTAFTSTEDLYDSGLTPIGSITGPATKQEEATTIELELTGDYPYIGMRSDNGTLYIDKIAITWNGESVDNPDTGGDNHGYSPDDPFTVSEVIALAETMSEDDTEYGVYVKGYVSEIGSFYSSYGDLDYYISDDGTTSNQFYVYNGYYLNGDKFTSEDQIKVGDEVVVTGDLTNYKGNTPELSRGNYIYSLNGETSDGGDDGGGGGESGGVNIGTHEVTLVNEGVTAGSSTAYIDMDLGRENATSVDGESFTFDDGATVTFAQGDGNNEPVYYTATKGIRVYALNTLTFSASKQIAKIVMTCDYSGSTDYVGNETATVEFSDTGAVYCNYHTSNSGGTQLRVQTITITYAEEGGTETGITSVETTPTNDGATYNLSGQRVSDSYQGVAIKNGRKFLKK